MARQVASTEAEKFVKILVQTVNSLSNAVKTPYQRIESLVETLEMSSYNPDFLILDLKTDDYLWTDPELHQAYKPLSPPSNRTFHGTLRIADRDLSVYSARGSLEGKVLVADSHRLGRLESDTGPAPRVKIREPEQTDGIAQDEEGNQYGGWMVLEVTSTRKLVIEDSAAGLCTKISQDMPMNSESVGAA